MTMGIDILIGIWLSLVLNAHLEGDSANLKQHLEILNGMYRDKNNG